MYTCLKTIVYEGTSGKYGNFAHMLRVVQHGGYHPLAHSRHLADGYQDDQELAGPDG